MARSNLATNLLFCYERKVIATRLMTFLRFTATTTIYHSNLEVQAKRLADDAGNKFWPSERRGHKISDTEKPFSVTTIIILYGHKSLHVAVRHWQKSEPRCWDKVLETHNNKNYGHSVLRFLLLSLLLLFFINLLFLEESKWGKDSRRR